MRYVMMTVMAAMLGFAAPQRAEAEPVLVELFTSQGCSSCPPADAYLGELAKETEVIALAFHVDYWDYLGWKDTFAHSTYSDRQRAYAPRVNREYIGRAFRGSFTPEIVVQGTDSLIGSARKTVAERVSAHAAKPALAQIGLTRQDGVLLVALTPVEGRGQEVRVMLARYMPTATVDVKRGENAGRTLTYHNVVKALEVLDRWDGTEAKTLQVADDGTPVAVFLQRGHAGPVVAAAALE